MTVDGAGAEDRLEAAAHDLWRALPDDQPLTHVVVTSRTLDAPVGSVVLARGNLGHLLDRAAARGSDWLAATLRAALEA